MRTRPAPPQMAITPIITGISCRPAYTSRHKTTCGPIADPSAGSATGPHESRAIMRLSEKVLAGLKLDAGRKDRLVFDATCPGLGVRLTAKGTRTFVVQWTDPATRRKVREPLGVWGSLTLDQAREAA